MLIQVVHETLFEYADDISESVMEVRLTPGTEVTQTIQSQALTVTPTTRLFPFRDYFGNAVHFFTVPGRYRSLSVVAESVVKTHARHPSHASSWRPAEPLTGGETFDYLQFGGPVCQHAELAVMAGSLPNLADPLRRFQAVGSLVYDRLAYRKRTTTINSDLAEVLAGGQGVCQDYAHLMIGVCRQMGVPARYVSGYVYVRPSSDVRGAGFSHAWCEGYLPGSGWTAFDPTNNVLVDESYVQVAVGRYYHDVPLTKGIYRGSQPETMTVTVRTERLDSEASG